jgi:hypothetical protein
MLAICYHDSLTLASSSILCYATVKSSEHIYELRTEKGGKCSDYQSHSLPLVLNTSRVAKP